MGWGKLSSVAMIAALAACASRPEPPSGPRPSESGAFLAKPIALVFVSFDGDGDRIVTKQELAASNEAEWRSADFNGDSSVTVFELNQWAELALGSAQARPGRLAFDTDGSGTISIHEFQKHLNLEFDQLDSDHDGQLHRADLVRVVSFGGRGQRGDKDGSKASGPGELREGQRR